MFDYLKLIWRRAPKPYWQHYLISNTRAYITYAAAIVWLLIIAFLIPHGILPPELISQISEAELTRQWLLITWSIIAVDSLIAIVLIPSPKSPRQILSALMNIVLPLCRISSIPAGPKYHVWLPFNHWEKRSRALSETVEWHLLPVMMIVTLFILPVIAAQFLDISNSPNLREWQWVLHAITSLIWFAFVLEFLTMLSVDEAPIDYVKKHWVNAVIIVLPLLAFLRTLQIIRLASMAQYTRAYRLRGVIARARNAVMLFSIVERIWANNPKNKMQRLLKERDELEQKLLRIESDLAKAHDDWEKQKKKPKSPQ